MRARKPATSCYEQKYPGDTMTAGIRAPPSPIMKEARDSECGSGQVGPRAGVQVEGAHLRRQGWVRQGPEGRREGDPGTPERREAARSGGLAMGSGCVAEAGQACAPRSGSREGRRAARPPADTWGPARYLPLGRP